MNDSGKHFCWFSVWQCKDDKACEYATLAIGSTHEQLVIAVMTKVNRLSLCEQFIQTRIAIPV